MHPTTQFDGCQVKLASVSETANHWWHKGGLPKMVEGYVLFFREDSKETNEEKKGVPTLTVWYPPDFPVGELNFVLEKFNYLHT